MSIDVIIAIRHPVMRRGVSCILAESPQTRVVGEAGTVESLRDHLRVTTPDVVLVDRTLIRLDSRSAIRALAENSPRTRFVQLSLYERAGGDDNGLDVLQDDSQSLIQTIVNASQFGATSRSGWIETVTYDSLTGREHEVLLLAAEGYTSSQIARRLSISPRTVELHRFRMCRKLGLHSPLELAKYVIRQGLVPI